MLLGGQLTTLAGSGTPSASVSVLVRFEPSVEPSLDLLAASARDDVADKATLDPGRGILRLAYPDRQQALVALLALRQDPDVASAEIEQARTINWVPTGEDDYGEQQAWLEQVNLPEAWNITTGGNEVVVAVIDSGVSPTHPDLASQLVEGYNAVPDGGDWADVSGHGTHIAGIIAASGDNGLGTIGVAPDVKIMPIRVMGPNGSISIGSIVDSIYWAMDHGADVINLSLGSENPSELEHQAILDAISNGIPVIASAGNKPTKISYPASYPEVISVGSVDKGGERASFSSVVSKVDLAAPGIDIFSPHWSEVSGDGWSGMLNDKPVSGTSFSTAIVSGVAALMMSVDPSLTPQELQSVLDATARDTGEPGLEAGVGAGVLDAESAVRQIAFEAMYDTWYRTDGPVASGAVSRTWLWGVEDPAHYAYEAYAEAQHETRLVYYYDKSRMEITNPLGDRDATWYVTNGLLVKELITGEMQIGDGAFETRQPAAVNVAGDPNDLDSPTYASFEGLLDAEPAPEGQVITATISQDGDVGSDPAFADYAVTAGYLEPATNHRVANVFWDYLNSTGLIYNDAGELVEAQLFEPWFYATGLPITEAYWTRVNVAGVERDVLIQCFERRCLTYTPANAENWQVEMGNVGMHYWRWRYESEQTEPPESEPAEPPADEDALPAEGELIYETNFQEWPDETFVEGTSFYAPASESYHIRVNEPGAFIAQTADIDVEDVSVSTTVQPVGGDAGQVCVVARAQGDFVTESSATYSLCLSGEGDVVASFEEWDDGDFFAEPLLKLPQQITTAEMAAGVELKIVAADSRFWFVVNGEVLGTAEDSASSSGDVGIYVLNQGSDVVEYQFRGLEVHAVES